MNARLDLMAGEADVALWYAMRIDDERLVCQRTGGVAIAFYIINATVNSAFGLGKVIPATPEAKRLSEVDHGSALHS